MQYENFPWQSGFLNFYVKLLFNDNTDEYFRDKLLFSFKLGQKQKQAEEIQLSLRACPTSTWPWTLRSECLSQLKKKKKQQKENTNNFNLKKRPIASKTKQQAFCSRPIFHLCLYSERKVYYLNSTFFFKHCCNIFTSTCPQILGKLLKILSYFEALIEISNLFLINI